MFQRSRSIRQGFPIPRELVGSGPCWLHNKAAIDLGKLLPNWIWWYTDEPPKRSLELKDIVEIDAPFDKDYVLALIPPKHQEKLNGMDNVYMTGYPESAPQVVYQLQTDRLFEIGYLGF